MCIRHERHHIILTPTQWAQVTVFMVGTRLVARVLAVYCMLIGSSIILGGEARFSAPGYTTALQMPGAPAVWGILMVAAGLLTLIGVLLDKESLDVAGLAMAGAWSMMFAVTFAWSAIFDPNANLTAMWVYGKDAFLFTGAATVLHAYRKVEVDEAPPED